MSRLLLCECEAHDHGCERFATMGVKVCGQTQRLCRICFFDALYFVSVNGYNVAEEFVNVRRLFLTLDL